jgi:N6-adenosine-specific RNA methylase IME4
LPDSIETKLVGLNGIAVSPGRMRKLRPEVVDQLVESIRVQGLLHPIILKPRSETGIGYILIAGWHRLEAVRKLGHEAIRAEIRTGLNADAALLAEIDENLMRAELSPAEESLHIGRRKALYERLHPETKHGGNRRSKTSGQNGHLNPRYTKDAAEATGKSERTLRRSGTRSKHIPEDVLANVIGTSLDKGEELDALGKLEPDLQTALADQAAAGEKVSAKLAVKQVNRDNKERDLAKRTITASLELGTKLYGVIYADPPWRFEPYSRDTGMDRSAENHYPTMTTEELMALYPPAATDAVLFLWATVPMLLEAMRLMTCWGFRYRSHFVWVKHKAGTGYWNRNRHELLLIGTKGNIPAPAPGEQYESVITFDAGKHSAKPFAFREIIEDMFPHLPRLEMFHRGEQYIGWAFWGNETVMSEKAAP